MAPNKSIRTYSRKNNSSVSCVEAFDILFANNLIQRRLNEKKTKRKTRCKFELKDLSAKIKTVLNDETSLMININDTFDNLLRESSKNKGFVNTKRKSTKTSFSVMRPTSTYGNVSPMLGKLQSYSDKTSLKNTSWFSELSLSNEKITDLLESKQTNGEWKIQNSTTVFKTSHLKYSLTPRLDGPDHTKNGSEPSELDSSIKSKRTTALKKVNNSSLKFNKSQDTNPKLKSVKDKILIHSSTPVARNRRFCLVGQPISPIKNQDELTNCIIQSLEEIDNWNLSLPNEESFNRELDNDSNSQAGQKGNLSFDLSYFEQIFNQLNSKSFESQKNISVVDSLEDNSNIVVCSKEKNFVNEEKLRNPSCTSILLNHFESFCDTYQQKLSLSNDSFFDHSGSIHFVTHRKHKGSFNGNICQYKKLDLKNLVVVLDNNLMNCKSLQFKNKDTSSNNRCLAVKLKRLSLDSLKLAANSSTHVTKPVFKAKSKRGSNNVKPCRKFCSNLSCQKTKLLPHVNINSSHSKSNLQCTKYSNIQDIKDNEISERILPTNSNYYGKLDKVNVKDSFCLDTKKDYIAKILAVSQTDNITIQGKSSESSRKHSQHIECRMVSVDQRFSSLTHLHHPDYSFDEYMNSSGHQDNKTVYASNTYLAQDLSESFFFDKNMSVNFQFSLSTMTSSLPPKSRKKSKHNLMDNIIDSGARSCDSNLLNERFGNWSISNNEQVDMTKSYSNIPIVNTLLNPQKLQAGKSWRRTFMQGKRKSLNCWIQCSDFDPINQSHLTERRRFSSKMSLSDRFIFRRKTVLQAYICSGMERRHSTHDLTSPTIESVVSRKSLITAREIVLTYCKQSEPLDFQEVYSKSLLKNCIKIGEGVYGEVFMYTQENGNSTVMKVIPIEGKHIVNGEKQKKFDEIVSEIVIVSQLSNLKNNATNSTTAFCNVQRICCVRGKYPKHLLDLWYLYNDTKGSQNDAPDIFNDDQLYIVLDLANGGQELEAFVFNNALQSVAMFKQVAYALAIGEEHLEFEHRDLHWGNVLLRVGDKTKKITFKHKGKRIECLTYGVEVTIIDFTLSRISYDGVVIFNNLGDDPDLFLAQGDYQFDIYRLMKEKNNNDWKKFTPYSNVLWLHYILEKSVAALRYKNVKTKIHKKYIDCLKKYKSVILSYNSASAFVTEYLS